MAKRKGTGHQHMQHDHRILVRFRRSPVAGCQIFKKIAGFVLVLKYDVVN